MWIHLYESGWNEYGGINFRQNQKLSFIEKIIIKLENNYFPVSDRLDTILINLMMNSHLISDIDADLWHIKFHLCNRMTIELWNSDRWGGWLSKCIICKRPNFSILAHIIGVSPSKKVKLLFAKFCKQLNIL